MKTTKREEAALGFLRSYIARVGCGPTLREFTVGMKLRDRKWAAQLLGNLERKGAIKRDKRVARGIRIVGSEREALLAKLATLAIETLRKLVREFVK